ncbi:galectin-4-like [Platysternon megacephalum]|uniref:Galectin-4-like n=1 Tax=Platysternon megacephalum TaxID=55544 RepID=A0A4D9E302_9SAUR|nr:galectin-4-like [Platysternon megacephalum]
MQFQPLEEIEEGLEPSRHVPLHLLNRLLATGPAPGSFGRRLSLLRRKNSCVSEASTSYSCLCQDTQSTDCSCGPPARRLPLSEVPFALEQRGWEGGEEAGPRAPGSHEEALAEESALARRSQVSLLHPDSAALVAGGFPLPQDVGPLVDTSCLLQPGAAQEPPARSGPPSAGYHPWQQQRIEEETTA